MGNKLWKKAAIVAKAETTYGSDAAPAITDGIFCEMPDHTINTDMIERNYIRSTLSPAGVYAGMTRQSIKFRMELKGAGDSENTNKASQHERLLSPCGFFASDVTVDTADERRQYSPSSDVAYHGSVSIYFYQDGILCKLIGCRGTAALTWTAGNFPYIEYTFTGLWVDPADVSLPTGITYESHTPPAVVSAGLVLGTFTPTGVEELSLDLGITIAERKSVNAATGLAEVIISGRSPKLTLGVDMEALATFNPYSDLKNNVTRAISWHAGSANGNRVFVEIAAAQLSEPPTKAEKNGRAAYNLVYLCTGTDNEVILQTG
jgi:hypothetical protein